MHMRDIQNQLMGILVMVLVLSACNLTRSKSGSPPSNANGTPSSATKFSPSNVAKKDLGDALRRLQTAFPYRLTEQSSSTYDGNKTPDTTRVAEFAAADRSRVKISGGFDQNIETITIGEKRYMNINGHWEEHSAPTQDQRQKFAGDLEKKLAEGTKEVKFLGAEPVNGVSCSAYSFVFEIGGQGQTYTGSGKAWIGADGLPHQVDSDYKYGKFASHSHVTYEYDVNFKIEPPK
jgi:hypothetical protein